MSDLKYEVRNAEGHLEIKVTGGYGYEPMLRMVDEIHSELTASGNERLLVDCSEMLGQVSETHRFYIASKIAGTFGPLVKIALVMPTGTVTKLGEMVANNRGANFFVTEDPQEAITWLST